MRSGCCISVGEKDGGREADVNMSWYDMHTLIASVRSAELEDNADETHARQIECKLPSSKHASLSFYTGSAAKSEQQSALCNILTSASRPPSFSPTLMQHPLLMAGIPHAALFLVHHAGLT